MRKIALLFCLVLLVFTLSCSDSTDEEELAPLDGNVLPPDKSAQQAQDVALPGEDVDSSTLSTDLYFIPDEGYRLDYAAQVHVLYNEDEEVYYAVHKDTREGNEGGHVIGNNLLHSSEDGLTFGEGIEHQRRTHSTDWGLLMPDPDDNGEYYYRRYMLIDGTLTSEVTYDGETFIKDDAVHYALEEGRGTGYYDLFVNNDGDIILLYIVDFASTDEHVELAVSTDNGETFELVDDNPLNDQGTHDSGMNQRDPRFTVLDDGTARLFTMVQGGGPPVPGQRAAGYIYSWSTEDGYTYTLDEGIRLRGSDFTEFDVWSLNDPHTLLLPDGRFRIYVTALIPDDSADSKTGYKEVIVSATTQS